MFFRRFHFPNIQANLSLQVLIILNHQYKTVKHVCHSALWNLPRTRVGCTGCHGNATGLHTLQGEGQLSGKFGWEMLILRCSLAYLWVGLPCNRLSQPNQDLSWANRRMRRRGTEKYARHETAVEVWEKKMEKWYDSSVLAESRTINRASEIPIWLYVTSLITNHRKWSLDYFYLFQSGGGQLPLTTLYNPEQWFKFISLHMFFCFCHLYEI